MITPLKFGTLNEERNQGWFILDYGRAGTGKTSLVKTLKGKVLYVGFEQNGYASIRNYDGDVSILKAWDEEEVLNLIRNLYQEMSVSAADSIFKDFDYIVYDSISTISQKLLEHFSKKYQEEAKEKSGNYARYTDMRSYGDVLKLMRKFFMLNRGLTRKLGNDGKMINVICIAQQVAKEGDFNKNMPSVDGNKLLSELLHTFDCIWHSEIDMDGNYIIRTKAKESDNYEAKDRSGNLDEIEPADAQLILDKMNGKVSSTSSEAKDKSKTSKG